MKLSPNSIVVPLLLATNSPATTRSTIASHRISAPRSRLLTTPSISSAMAPQARISSGSNAVRLSA